jgi:NTP pyrophosphatase (non-canonical NTP hydrolase)
MTKFIRWTKDQPEPADETVVSVDAYDCSWRLPWKDVREDALSGLAAVYLEEEEMTDHTLEHIMEVNMRRCEAWHKSDQPWSNERWITAIVGELGELANNVKKIFRAEDGSVGILKGETVESLRAEIGKEWADTMLYMLLFAGHNNIDPFTAIADVFNAKSEQLGFEERL